MSAPAEPARRRAAVLAAPFLILVGIVQMTGDILGLTALKGIGAAWGASPAPKVFSSVRGLETYSTRFFVEWTDPVGETHSVLLTPEIYGRLRGPYNRRNIYGAALAYGPVLMDNPATRRLLRTVTGHALCGDAPLLQELGLDVAGATNVRVRYEPVAGTDMGDLARLVEAPCR